MICKYDIILSFICQSLLEIKNKNSKWEIYVSIN